MTRTDGPAVAHARPTRRAWAALVLIATPMFMMATDFTIMFMAMPQVAADLTPSTTQLLWIMHVGEFVAAGLVITMGWLTGRLGHKHLLLAAMALYGSASALAAFAPNPETLLVARVLIGLATAAASPAAFSMVRSLFADPRHFGVAFAILMGAFTAGAAIGPPMGGVLLEYFWWGSVFLVNVPAAALVLVFGWALLPSPDTTTGGRIDTLSVGLSLSAVILVVLGLQEIADRGLSTAYGFVVVTGLVLGIWFVRRQRRLANPLLDLSLFAIRPLRNVAIVFVVSSLAFVAVDFIVIQYLQIVVGVSTARLGLLLISPGVAAILGTALTPVLARRRAPSTVMTGGLFVSLGGVLTIMTALLSAPQSTALFVVGTTLISVGATPLMLLGAQLLITSAPRERSGSAVAIQDISAGLGGALGMAAIGSLAMAVFSRMVGLGAPASVPDAALDAAAQSPGGAVGVADDLGGVTGQNLLTVVHDAWSMSTLAAYAAALVLGVATIVLVHRGLRGVLLPTGSGVAVSQPAVTLPSGRHRK